MKKIIIKSFIFTILCISCLIVKESYAATSTGHSEFESITIPNGSYCSLLVDMSSNEKAVEDNNKDNDTSKVEVIIGLTTGVKQTMIVITTGAMIVGLIILVIILTKKNKNFRMFVIVSLILVIGGTGISIANGMTETSSGTPNAYISKTGNTAYTVYVIGVDRAGNASGVLSKEFTTCKTMPKVTTNPTLSGTYGTAVKDMTVTNGVAKAGDTVIDGTWTLTDTKVSDVPSVGTTNTYEVTFTPDAKYNGQ